MYHQVFDAISYCKGSTVVNMVCAVVGQEKFRQGLQTYMSRHAYGNTETGAPPPPPPFTHSPLLSSYPSDLFLMCSILRLHLAVWQTICGVRGRRPRAWTWRGSCTRGPSAWATPTSRLVTH